MNDERPLDAMEPEPSPGVVPVTDGPDVVVCARATPGTAETAATRARSRGAAEAKRMWAKAQHTSCHSRAPPGPA